MGKVETEILSQSALKPLTWKRYIDDIFSLWDTSREDLTQFIDLANKHHPTIKFTAEISDTETTFLDTSVYKGERFTNESVLDIRTHYKPTETFQYTHFSSCHPPGVKKGFIKGEALRLLRTNSSKTAFEEKIKLFQSHLIDRGYPEGLGTKCRLRTADSKCRLTFETVFFLFFNIISFYNLPVVTQSLFRIFHENSHYRGMILLHYSKRKR